MITIVHQLAGALGRMLIAVGALTMAFAVFQFWGTGLAEARAQKQLDDQLLAQLAFVREEADEGVGGDHEQRQLPETLDPDRPETIPAAADSARTMDLAATPDLGEAAGRIIIPAIDVDKTFVHGVRRDDLRKGPGRYPQSALPGQWGNAAIAGHRTTYGAPFHDLDRLVPGDEIIVETLQGRFTYLVEGHGPEGGGDEARGHFIVDPTATWVLDDRGDSRLTLTACHPKRSAARRIVVTAILETGPASPVPVAPVDVDATVDVEAAAEAESAGPDADRTPETAIDDAIATEYPSLDETLGWQPEHWPTTALWAALSAAIAMTGRLLGRRLGRVPAYAVTSLPFLVSLFICFTHLDRLMPAI